MNREIKFRAWDNGEMKQPYLSIDSEGIQMHGTSTSKNLILMQYTGLKDKKAKEIYKVICLSNSVC